MDSNQMYEQENAARAQHNNQNSESVPLNPEDVVKNDSTRSSAAASRKDGNDLFPYAEDDRSDDTVKMNKAVKPDQAQTPIPFGLNRWVYLLFGMLIIVVWGPLVMNWGEIAGMLQDAKVYRWVCDNNSSDPNKIFKTDSDSCNYQEAILGRIGILSMGVFFIGAFVSGCLLDHFGPKVVAIIGGSGISLSYLLLAVASEKTRTYYAYGMVQGFSIEFVFYAIFSIPNLFPKRRALILSLLGTSRSAAMLLCPLMKAIRSDTFTVSKIGYTFMGLSLAMLLFVVILVPNQPFKVINTEEEDDAQIETSESLKEDYKLWGITCTVPFYIFWLICDAILFARAQFHIVSLSTQHPRVATPFGILAGVSFVYCPFIGLLIDRFSALPIIFGLNLLGTAGYICLISGDSIGAQWCAVLFLSVVLSFLGSQNYVLIQERFVGRICGKLSGLVTCFGGVISFTNTPVWNWAKLHNRARAADGIFLAYSAVCSSIIILLWIGPKFLTKSPCFPGRTHGLLSCPNNARILAKRRQQNANVATLETTV